MQQGEVGQVVSAQRLSEQVSVNQSKTMQSASTRAMSTQLRKKQLVVITTDHVLNPTTPIDQDPDLSSDGSRDLRHRLGELHRDHLLGRYTPPIHAIERV